MIDQEYEAIGKGCRDAVDGNLLVGSFAAELVGESYPLSKAMCEIIFKTYSDIDLGKRFEKWMKSNEA